MKNKITSAEYQALPIQIKNRYTRYSGSDEVYYEIMPSQPIPEAQPLDGVKTVEADIWPTLNEFGIYKGDTITENTSISIALMLNKVIENNAQFATDAGGGKDIEQAAEAYLNKCVSIDGHSPYYGFIAGANWMKENARATTDKSSVVQFASKQKVKATTGRETEPDSGLTLTCIECDEKQIVSGQWADFNEIDNSNFVCHNCQYLYD